MAHHLYSIKTYLFYTSVQIICCTDILLCCSELFFFSFTVLCMWTTKWSWSSCHCARDMANPKEQHLGIPIGYHTNPKPRDAPSWIQTGNYEISKFWRKKGNWNMCLHLHQQLFHTCSAGDWDSNPVAHNYDFCC